MKSSVQMFSMSSTDLDGNVLNMSMNNFINMVSSVLTVNLHLAYFELSNKIGFLKFL